MGLVSLIFFLCFTGKLRGTPVKFVFDVDPSEIKEEASARNRKSLVASYPSIYMDNNEERERAASYRTLSGSLGDDGNNREMSDRSLLKISQDLNYQGVFIRGTKLYHQDTESSLFTFQSNSDPGSDGRRCIEKVETVEEIEYDEVVQCEHSYDKRCHTTYVTNYIRKVLLDVPIPGFKCFF